MTAKWCKEEVKEKTNRVDTPELPARTSPITPKKKEELKKVPPKSKN